MQIILTYARILRVVQQGDTRYFDISVQLPEGGEWNAGLIEARGYVMANGLIVGMWVDGEFMPFGGVENVGGGGSLIFGKVTQQQGPAVGLQSTLQYQVRWYLPGGEEVREAQRARDMYPGEAVHRIAFPVGATVWGQEVVDESGATIIEIVDREDYAVGCDG